jgi:hypothetical protein
MGRELTHTDEAVAQSDVVILAVRDVVLGCASVTAPAETRHAKREFWTTAPDFS